MSKIKLGLLKKYNSLLSILLTVLGFSTACEQMADEYGTGPVEYGTPNATFIVKGEIESQENSAAIPNIRVIMGYDTAYSDQDGNYEVKNNTFPDDQSFIIEFKDIDGATNGEYDSEEKIVEFTDPEFTGGSGWYSGETSEELNVSLKSKE